ncbi:uncharacterized protein A4U43_C06F4270 [Asparagus officinalis]|uniref:Autophagy-related protein 2 n=1 Tax=Asparagus officinalis TaxID=4686 RepID=A0A5P1EJI1_ASPOF|nr:autophagy-related protein 2 [Asparagus officinalis]ONK66112.1 uncharacterized protein A4U43_C06F4270 [Asparagus officinalis]
MFSRWGFARSAEAMFSRWAVKRVCKFLLKKKLGDFILGDIDLDQLDVQITQGTIHLSDLALNVDFLNQKLAGSAVMVKEGSIGSLSIKIPWKLQNCQIEVDELELVLAPFTAASAENMSDSTDKSDLDTGTVPGGAGSSVSLDVHEGVKTIAKIVKWFLTSFHVRLRNLIVAFDPSSNIDEKRASDFYRSLVLRIGEMEYGTCVSEDPKTDCLLGIAKLTNFVKFHGAVIEFLKMDDVDGSLQHNSTLGTSFSQWHTKSLPLDSTVIFLTGDNGGFSGKLNISIPWKNGSLDVRKVDADFSLDPIELRLQPSTIKWIAVIWQSVKNLGAASRSHSPRPATVGSDVVSPSKGNFFKSLYSSVMEEASSDSQFRQTNVIQNWVPLSLDEEVETELEQDYGASIDQFFECFDGMRSARGGSSSIWNWTCSVFSAITVASDLASGAGHIPIEQQNVETSLQATIAEVLISLSFHDENPNTSDDLTKNGRHFIDSSGTALGSRDMSNIDTAHVNGPSPDSFMSCFSSLNMEQSAIADIKSINPTIHHLEATCQNLLFNLQIFPQKTNFEASLVYFKVDEHHVSRDQFDGFGFPVCSSNPDEKLLLNGNLQREVQDSLPPFPFPVQDHNSEISANNNKQHYEDGLMKVVLLESFGTCSCHCSINSMDLDGKTMKSTSFSINLPPFVLWVHFQLVSMLLTLFKSVENYFEGDAAKEFLSGVMKQQHDPSFLHGFQGDNSTYITTVSSRVSLQGKVLFPRARVILCCPLDCHGNFGDSNSLDKFIILELYPSGKGSVSDARSLLAKSSLKGNPCASSTSFHFGIGDFDLYLIDTAREDADKCGLLGRRLTSAVKILSGINKTGDQHAGITMVCQEGLVTGPWMAGRAWSLASSQDHSRNKVAGKSSEYSSVRTGEDSQEISSHIRQELILSSAFFLHVHFSHVWISLDDHAYKLVIQIMEDISNAICGIVTTSDHMKSEPLSLKVGDISQASILLNCDSLNISIILNEAGEINPSMQKELEGSWNNFRLTVDKFELLSVSNVGGVSDATFFWLNHGEGELWGSILSRDEKAQDFLLIACRNSTVRRGDGKGANALSFGPAGTTVLYLRNPQLFQSYTSIVVRCGTLIAPGGRMDWVSAICLFFSCHENVESSNDGVQIESSADDTERRGSFYLDLVDVALSYEPHRKTLISGDPPDVPGSGIVEVNKEIGEQYVACLLAAASLSFSNHTVAHQSEVINYTIQLKDLGVLVCDSSSTSNDNNGHHASHLRMNGYVKVAQVALVEAVLRIKGMFWEIDCSDSHINLDTCQDTTAALARLVAQLQQLYAPDMEDAKAHLQSRWNTVQQTHENTSNELADNSSVKSSSEKKPSVDSDEHASVGLLDEILENAFNPKLSSEKKLSVSSDEHVYVGLLDEIIENAFNSKGDTKLPADHGSQSRLAVDGSMSSDNYTSTAVDVTSPNIPSNRSMRVSGTNNKEKTSTAKTCFPHVPQVIESYYSPEPQRPSKSTAGNCSTNDSMLKFDVGNRDIECGKGGWYRDNPLIVENHVSKSDQTGNAPLISQDKLKPVGSNATDDHSEKGQILLKNIDFRWRMYSGLDWSEPRKKSKCNSCLRGRDKNKCLELMLSGLDVKCGMYPEGEISVTKLSVCVQDLHLYDRSRDAPWKMVLGYYNYKNYPRESSAQAVKLDLEVVRPDPLTPIEDYRLHLELLPLRLHLDQSQLNFLIGFFSNGSVANDCPNLPNDVDGSDITGIGSGPFGSQPSAEEALLPFFQKCDVKPVVVCIDYIPRHMNLAALRRGNYAELLNLVPWKGIELHLKHVCAVGLYGWGSVCETVFGQWLEDISHNQVHKLLKGIAPVRSFVSVSKGTSKLVSLPVKSYRKDQKFLKGMQRGAITFLRSVSLEAVGLGVHLAAGAHEVLLQTEYMLTSIPPSVSVSETRPRTTVRSNQPEDAQQGIHRACESLSDGFGRTASALVGTPLKVYQRGAGAKRPLDFASFTLREKEHRF